MFRKDIIELVNLYAKHSGTELDYYDILKHKLKFDEKFTIDFDSFNDQLLEIAEFVDFNFDIKFATKKELVDILDVLTFPVIAFKKNGNDLSPIIIDYKSKKAFKVYSIAENGFTEDIYKSTTKLVDSLKNIGDLKLQNNFKESVNEVIKDDNIVFFVGYKFSIGIKSENKDEERKKLTPLQRFFRLLKAEKKDIGYIYFFAIMIALISLTLPLGIQSIIGLISGGLLLHSVIVLILLVVIATFTSGWLQVQQLAMVEVLQQRVFAKTALEFAFRIPRIKAEELIKQFAPELINRFFDILNVQKSLPKILIDFTSAVVQIVFGLILLSFYHPLFIFFALLLLSIMVVIFYFTGKKGLETSLNESKYKYKVAYWLEEIARSVSAFKLAGYSNFAVYKTDMLLDSYLKYRKKHFKVLVKQYISIVAFKTFVTAGLLVMGGLLVVNRQINLGQFVAAEIIIVLVITSVEKLISSIAVIYDMLTALDKIGYVIDLQLEKKTGKDIADLLVNNNFNLSLNNISYAYPGSKNYAVKNINLDVKNGEKICIAGYNDAGKTTLLNIISAMYQSYEGTISVNDLSLKEISLNSYRNIVSDNLRTDDIFEGTIFDNITLGRKDIHLSDVIEACQKAYLMDFINQQIEGFSTLVQPKGENFPSNIVRKILLARSFIKGSKLLIIDEFFRDVQHKEKQDLINNVFNESWAVIIITSQTLIMEKCDKVLIMQDGSFIAEGTYTELSEKGLINDLFN